MTPSASLISKDGGTHEVTRCYYDAASGYQVAYSTDRLGPHRILAADWETGKGLKLSFSRGLTMVIPFTMVRLTYLS